MFGELDDGEACVWALMSSRDRLWLLEIRQTGYFISSRPFRHVAQNVRWSTRTVSYGGRDETADQLSPDDRKKLNELTDAVQFASPTLTISQTDGDITITSTRGGTQTFHTNGKVEKQPSNAGTVDRVASWEGLTLVVAYEVGHAGTLTHTYLLVPTTKQLLIRVNFERRLGQPGPFDIKLVYNRVVLP